MKARRTKLALILLGVVAVSLCGLWAGFRRPSSLPAVTLPDGSVVRVIAFGVRQRHIQPYESLPARVAAILPQKWQSFLPVSAALAYSGPEPTLGVWLEWDRMPQAPVKGTGGYSLLLLNDGRLFSVRAVQSTSLSLSDGRYVEGHFFLPPPLASPVLTATLHGENESSFGVPQTNALATWNLATYVRRSRSAPSAQPAPQSRMVGDLDVTLLSLVIDADGTASDDEILPSRHPAESVCDARFSLRQNQLPTTDWQVNDLRLLSDVPGMEYDRIWSMMSDKYIRWANPLWPNQRWKLAIEFIRTRGFPTNELCTVAGLRPNVAVVDSASPTTGKILSVELNPPDQTSGQWQLAVMYGPVSGPASLTLVSARDSAGRSFAAGGYPGFQRDGFVRFDLPGFSTNGGPLEVTLALQLKRIAEFTVEPTFLNTNQAILLNAKDSRR